MEYKLCDAEVHSMELHLYNIQIHMAPSLSVYFICSLLSLFLLLLLKTLWTLFAGDRRGGFCRLSSGGSADDGRTRGDSRGQLLHGPKTQCRALDRPRKLWAPSPWHRQPSVHWRLVEAVCMCVGCKTERIELHSIPSKRAGSGPDRLGSIGQNLTQAAWTKSDPGWCCTILSGTTTEEWHRVWQSETGRNRARWFLLTSLLPDQMHLTRPWPGHPDRIRVGFAQYDPCLLWKNSWNGCGKR